MIMIQQLLNNRTTVLVIAGCVIVGGLAAMLSIYRSADAAEFLLERSGSEIDEDIYA